VSQIKSHKSVEEIARKHRLDVSFVKNQLKMGISIEHEHTKNKDLATDIALQHLDEIPDYYTRLKKMESSMSKKERNRRSAKKRREDPNPNRSGAAKIVTKEEYIQEKKGEKDACYSKVKSRYKIWPSAYASGALVKCRKVGADNWGTKSEDCWDGYEQKGMKKKGKKMVPNCVPIKENKTMLRYCPKCQKDETRSECKYGPKFWDMYSMPSILGKDYDPNTPHPGNFPESYDHEHSMARSEISTIISAAKRLRKKLKGEGNIEAWVQSKITKAADYLDSAADYVDSGEMKEQVKPIEGPYDKFDRLVNAANAPSLSSLTKVKVLKSAAKIHPSTKNPSIDEQISNSIEYSNWRADFGLSEDWQKVNRQDKTDGLSPAAVKAYRRENPGSKLQTAVTEKKPNGKRAKRRASFCSRMSGMKDKLTSEKTARDPDSRINKALRRWRCN
jgi:hypothetical protein